MFYKNSILRYIFDIFTEYRLKIVIILFLFLLDTTINLFLPILNKHLMDEGFLCGDISAVIFYSLFILGIVFTNSFISLIGEFIRSKIVLLVISSLHLKVFRFFTEIDFSFFSTYNSSELYNNTSMDIENIASVFSESNFLSLSMLFSFIGGFCGLLYINLSLALFVIIFIPVKFLIIKILSQWREHYSTYFINGVTKFAHWFDDTINGMKDIRLFLLKEIKSDELNKKINSIYLNNRKISILDTTNRVLDLIIIQSINAVVTILGAVYVFKQELSLGSLFAFLAFCSYVVSPISIIINIRYQISSILPSAKRLFTLLNEKKLHMEILSGYEIDSIHDIEFVNVVISYDFFQVLRDVTFRIEKPSMVAIIGKNGSGKSTLINALQGFIFPSSGNILINGIDITEINIDSLRKRIGCSNQDGYLFDSSVLDNILLYKKKDNDKLKKICHACNIELSMISSMDSIGPNGCKLSGGQRQKILMARNLYQDKDIYIFDESSSNLDKISEDKILNYIDEELKNKFVFFISHNQEIIKKFKWSIKINNNKTVTFYFH